MGNRKYGETSYAGQRRMSCRLRNRNPNHSWIISCGSARQSTPRHAPSSGSFGCWTYGADHRAWCHDTMTVTGTPEYYTLSLLFWDRSRTSGLLMGHSGLEGGSFMLFRVRGSLRKGKPAQGKACVRKACAILRSGRKCFRHVQT